MLELSSEADFPEEAFRAQGGGQFGMEDLKCDRAVVLDVVGQVHRGHPATPELALERVTPFESGLQTGDHGVHDVPVIEGCVPVCGAGKGFATAAGGAWSRIAELRL